MARMEIKANQSEKLSTAKAVNTDTFTYRFKAKLVNVAPGTGDSVTISREFPAGYEGTYIFEDVHYSPEKALVGTSVPVYASAIHVYKSGSCITGEPCVYNSDPVAGEEVYWYAELGSQPTMDDLWFTSSTTDSRGVATANIDILPGYAGQTLYVAFRHKNWGYLRQAKQIEVKTAADFNVKVLRVDAQNGSNHVLLDGGIVCPSRDGQVIVQINNPTSYYMKLKLVDENNVLDPARNTPQYRENEIVVFPGSKEYFFDVKQPRIWNMTALRFFQFNLYDNNEAINIFSLHANFSLCIANEMKYHYLRSYQQYLSTMNRSYFYLGVCGPYWLLSQPIHSVIPQVPEFVCQQFANDLMRWFSSQFCNYECTNCVCMPWGSGCTFDGYTNQCTSVFHVHDSQGYHTSASLPWHIGNSHDWVEVGFKDCSNSNVIEWTNYDPWWDVCNDIADPW